MRLYKTAWIPGMLLPALLWTQIPAAVSQSGSARQRQARPAHSSQIYGARAPVARPASFAGVPLTFEKNLGQLDGRFKFLARAEGYSLFLTATGAVLSLRVPVPATPPGHRLSGLPLTAGNTRSRYRRSIVELAFAGANPNSLIAPTSQLQAKTNYFLSGGPTRWWNSIPNYAGVEYRGLYPGIDLVYRGVQNDLEYDFIVSPGNDPRSIVLAFRNAAKVELDPAGSLIIRAGGGELKLHKPHAYQEHPDGRHTVAARYAMKNEALVNFVVGPYDRGKPLVIDPSLSYSTYLGGSGVEHGGGLAVDASGNLYVTGQTASTDFVTNGAIQSANAGGQDVFVTKLNPAGNAVVYSTFIGGSGDDIATGIAVDAAGSAYLTGYTNSANFPVNNALQPTIKGGFDAFVTKLNPAGSALVYSTYLGGSQGEFTGGIAIDSAGSATVVGSTSSADFPLLNAIQAKNKGGIDAFIAKLNPAGSALVYSTFLGGSSSDFANTIALDNAGNAFVAGATSSPDFRITAGAFRHTCGCSPRGTGYYQYFPITEGWAAKIDSAGSTLLYSTYLGGASSDSISGIAVDASGDAVVTGSTSSADFPVLNPAISRAPGSTNAFLTKFNPAGSALIFSTFLGGSDVNSGAAVAIDGAGNAYVAGTTTSTDFPVKNTFQATLGGASDGFITKISPAGAVVYSSYLGGLGTDTMSAALAVDSSGNVYVAGDTDSANFPTHSAVQPNLGGASGDVDAFVAKISPSDATGADLSITSTVPAEPSTRGGTLTYTHTITNHGPDAATGVRLTDTLPAGMVPASSSPSQGTCTSTSPILCDLGTLNSGHTSTVTLNVTTPDAGLFQNIATVSATQPDSSSGNNMTVSQAEVDADFSLAVSPAKVSVTAGVIAAYKLRLSAQGGPFSLPITFSCSHLPPLSFCQFDSTFLSLGSDPAASQTTNLEVLTTAPITTSLPHRRIGAPVYASWLLIAVVFATGARGRWRRRIIAAGLGAFLLLLISMEPGCANDHGAHINQPGTPAGTYDITVAAKSASTAHSAKITLIVQ